MREPLLVIMAAGIGSRFGGLKQIEPVGPSGEKIIDYSVYDAIKAGFKKVAFIIQKSMEKEFREIIGKKIEENIEVIYIYQSLDRLPYGFKVPEGRIKPWGTAHALLCAKEIADVPTGVLNADDFYGAQSYSVLYNFLKDINDTDKMYNFCMVGYEIENTLSEYGHVARGICRVNQNSELIDIFERTKIKKSDKGSKYTEDNETWIQIPEKSIVSMNLWGFSPWYYHELEKRFKTFLSINGQSSTAEYLIPTIVNDLLLEKKASVKVLKTPEKWFGVTYKEDKPFVKNGILTLVNNGVYPAVLWRQQPVI